MCDVQPCLPADNPSLQYSHQSASNSTALTATVTIIAEFYIILAVKRTMHSTPSSGIQGCWAGAALGSLNGWAGYTVTVVEAVTSVTTGIGTISGSWDCPNTRLRKSTARPTAGAFTLIGAFRNQERLPKVPGACAEEPLYC